MSDYWNPVNIKTTKVYEQVCKAVPVGAERDHCVGVVIKALNRHRDVWSIEEQERVSLRVAFNWGFVQCEHNLPQGFFSRVYMRENPYV